MTEKIYTAGLQDGKYFAKASDIFPKSNGRMLVSPAEFAGAADNMARERGPRHDIERLGQGGNIVKERVESMTT